MRIPPRFTFEDSILPDSCQTSGWARPHADVAAQQSISGNLTPGLMVDLAHMDIELALDWAAAKNVQVPLGSTARKVYRIARGQNRRRQDWSAIYTMIRKMAGLDK